MIVFRH